MYVRWKRRTRGPDRWGKERGAVLDAVLVASARADGRVRQRFICHLGRVTEDEADRDHIRVRFWRDVASRLAGGYAVGGQAYLVTPEVRSRIEQTLAARVPKPTPEAVAAADAAERALWTTGGPPPVM